MTALIIRTVAALGAAALLLASAVAGAQPATAPTDAAKAAASPAGLWRTIDDNTGKPSALVRIVVRDGVASGMVERDLDPAAKPDDACQACTDERKGQRIVGLPIIRNLRPEGERWGGGDILDPDNGKVYSARIKLIDGGRKLEVRGFLGVSLLGRTQVWERVE
jgi:uncharacterized protein (DUF2147 family)